MKHVTLLLLLVGPFSVLGQAPEWAWARRAGDSGTEDAYATATDPNGNVLVAGYFTSSTITFGGVSLDHEAYEDAFLVKYTNAGDVIWARSATGIWYDEVMRVTTDLAGNVIVVGFFNSDSLHFGDTTITSAGSFDGFVAKYDPDGSLLWARSLGGEGLDHCYAVATDPNGNIFAAGDFSSPSFTFGSSTLTSTAYYDAMLVKYDGDGNAVWGRAMTGDYANQVTGLATGLNGNPIVCGYFNSSVLDLDGGSLVNTGSTDGFVAEYNGSGVLQWMTAIQGEGSDVPADIATDAEGAIALAGTFSSPVLNVGGQTAANPSGDDQTFLVKLSDTGSAIWSIAGSSGANYATGVAADANGDFLVSGYFDTDALAIGSLSVDPNGDGADIYVAKCSSDGSMMWLTTAGSDSQDKALGICTDAMGGVFVAGWFSGTEITFGANTLVNVPGSDDLFIAKLDGNTGLFDVPVADGLMLYPNPARSGCMIMLPRIVSAGTISILDPQGRVLRNSRFFGERIDLDVSSLQAGAYHVRVIAPGIDLTRPLLVQ